MTPNSVTTSTILLAALALAGCSEALSGLGLREPTAEYQGLAVTALDLSQVGFDLGFDLANPNSFDLPVATIDWNIDLFERPFSFGEIRFEDAAAGAPASRADGGVLTYLGIQHIPANGELALNAPFAVALLDTFEGIARVAMGEDIPYTIGGTLYFETRFASFDLPFSASGVWLNADLIGFLGNIGEDIINDLIN